MPKAILKYDLNDPDDAREFKCATKAKDALCALNDVYDKIRSTEKYDAPHITMSDFSDILEAWGIDLNLLN